MLPTHTPTFKSYCEPAVERAEWWRTLAGFLLIAGLYGAIFAGLGWMTLKIGEAIELGFGYRLLFEVVTFSSKRAVLIGLFSVVLILPALWLVMRFLHKRPFSTLLSPHRKIHWKAYFLPALLLVVLYMVVEIPWIIRGDTRQQLSLSEWLPWMVPALILLFLQTATEELVFRGYLMQQLAARFHSRWVWMVIPSLLFGAIHYAPQQYGENTWLVMAAAALTGFVLADITARFGNLSIAMGLHFGNNLIAIFVVSSPGYMSALSLFLDSSNVKDIDATRLSLLLSMGLTLSAYLIYLLVMRARR